MSVINSISILWNTGPSGSSITSTIDLIKNDLQVIIKIHSFSIGLTTDVSGFPINASAGTIPIDYIPSSLIILPLITSIPMIECAYLFIDTDGSLNIKQSSGNNFYGLNIGGYAGKIGGIPFDTCVSYTIL